MRYAIVRNGVVENVVLWDGIVLSEAHPNAWDPPIDTEVVAVGEDFCDVGDLYLNGAFERNPNPSQPPEPDDTVVLDAPARAALNALFVQLGIDVVL